MGKIEQLSAEFDTYDLDGNRYIDYLEYKNFLLSNILVSDQLKIYNKKRLQNFWSLLVCI